MANFQPSKYAKIHQNQNSESLDVLKWQILALYLITKFDFTENFSIIYPLIFSVKSILKVIKVKKTKV